MGTGEGRGGCGLKDGQKRERVARCGGLVGQGRGSHGRGMSGSTGGGVMWGRVGKQQGQAPRCGAG